MNYNIKNYITNKLQEFSINYSNFLDRNMRETFADYIHSANEQDQLRLLNKYRKLVNKQFIINQHKLKGTAKDYYKLMFL